MIKLRLNKNCIHNENRRRPFWKKFEMDETKNYDPKDHVKQILFNIYLHLKIYKRAHHISAYFTTIRIHKLFIKCYLRNHVILNYLLYVIFAIMEAISFTALFQSFIWQEKCLTSRIKLSTKTEMENNLYTYKNKWISKDYKKRTWYPKDSWD